jgi:hypothetical protein
MNLLRNHGWRIALVASGVFMVTGAPRHPSSDAKYPMREELAIMTSHPDWVPAHLLVMLSTVLFAAGLLTAYRKNVWPEVRPALGMFLGLPAAVGGLAHAVSVPLTWALPDAELSPLFAASALLFATYALVSGLAGAPRPAVFPAERQPVTV